MSQTDGTDTLHSPMPPSVRQEDLVLELADGPVAARWFRPAGASAGDGPVLVFLHEALGCIAMWRDVPAKLAQLTGLPALAYDRHGHGRSGPLAGPRRLDYLDREACEVLPAVLAAAGVDAPLLIGHSDGGSIALLYAARFPVRAVVTEAAHVFVEEITRAGIRDAVRAWGETDLSSRLARHHGRKTAALFEAWAETWLSDAFASWNIEAALPNIACPVLVIQGEDDEYGTLRQVTAIAGGVAGPVRRLVVPGCGHIPHFLAADQVLPAIAEFVAARRD